MSYSPGSEAETAAKQDDPLPDAVAHDADIDTTRINAVPARVAPTTRVTSTSIPRMSSADRRAG